jgi:four helix bundle protein
MATQPKKYGLRLLRIDGDGEWRIMNVQMRRAALSLTNNIAEGHGRYHYLDNIKFVLISRGALFRRR